jgi:hypothetical protein
MGITYYTLKILIQDPYDNMFEDILNRCQAKFKNITGTQIGMTKPDTIEITRDDWTYTLVWVNDEDYLMELKEMAKIVYKEKSDYQQIIYSTNCYIDGWSTDDPNMNYFNDYVSVQEVFDQIPNIYIIENEELIRSSDATKPEE